MSPRMGKTVCILLTSVAEMHQKRTIMQEKHTKPVCTYNFCQFYRNIVLQQILQEKNKMLTTAFEFHKYNLAKRISVENINNKKTY